MIDWKVYAFLVVALSCFWLPMSVQANLVLEEVDVLGEIATTMGFKSWEFDAENCSIGNLGLSSVPPAETSVECYCINQSETDCHVTKLIFKYYNLSGVLPPQLIKLPYLTYIDFAYNYLNGSFPREWSSLNLSFISLTVNRLSGQIPEELAKMTSLKYLNLEANHLSGVVPAHLGKLVNLETLILSSNLLSGELPKSLGELRKLTDFRINDNNLKGSIPNFIQNWKILQRLEIHGSGLEGPIPNISLLNDLQHLIISDIGGPTQEIPSVATMNNLVYLVLKSCNLVGEIPSYIWNMDSLQMIDLSFNDLVGKIPSEISGKHLKFVFLTANKLSGNIPDSLLKTGSSVDLSYNQFSYQYPNHHSCQKGLDMNINLYRSSSPLNTSARPLIPCLMNVKCPHYSNCLHVDCGGTSPNVEEDGYKFAGDGNVYGGVATYYIDSQNQWGFSSTGDYMDDFDFLNSVYVDRGSSPELTEIYSTARKAPITLSYFHRCLENGKYNVILYFAELKFTDDASYNSLGKRVFDVYVQDALVRKNFNILDEVHLPQVPFQLRVNGVDVVNNFIEVRLSFAGKGTTRIPERGVYGPIISGLSVVSQSNGCREKVKKRASYAAVGAVLGGVLCAAAIIGILLRRRKKKRTDESDTPAGTFSLKQIKAATNDFASENKIGEGGFGPVYKGVLCDGTVVAVKQLSSKSKQGNKEFLNEIAMISCLKHPNVVKLHGFCVEDDQLLLVYEYMANNNLSRALFGHGGQKLELDWPTRRGICIGIAKGLSFLHEESKLRIVHRDVKATNVLLDENLNPKISDFGLARLNEEDKTHVSTKVVGTIGYMAPEYALWGYLTYKVDVYSFGVVMLEVISGRSNSDCMPSRNCFCLLDLACHLQKSGNLVDIVDDFLVRVVEEEALRMVKVALLCTSVSPTLRPTMSEVVAMLLGDLEVPDLPESCAADVRFNALRDLAGAERVEISHVLDGRDRISEQAGA